MCAVRAEQHELRFSPAMSNDDFLSYLKKEGLEDTDCSKLFGNDKTVNSSCSYRGNTLSPLPASHSLSNICS